jgi:hypothetical protein
MRKLALVPPDLTGSVTPEAARVKLKPLGMPLRAKARAHEDGRLVLEAELPWLRLGASCTAELSDGRNIDGTVHWIGIDMTRTGTARLRILVNTQSNQSIQLSLSDADVQELLPAPRKRRRFRWMLPIVLTMLTGGGVWAATHTPRPQLLPAAVIETSARRMAIAPTREIPFEEAPAPAPRPSKPARKHKRR